MEKFNSLDGLRTLAAIGIVATHIQANFTSPLPNGIFFSKIIPSCSNLVFLFMILSAFSMCCGYYNKFKNKQIDIDKFYKKRYSRIWPFFALLVGLDLITSPSLPSLYEAFANLTLFFGFLPNAGIEVIGVGWFLGIIFAFYTIFPFFIFLIDNKKRAWFVLIIALIFNFLASNYFSRPELVVKPVDKFNILYCMPTFIIGGLVFLYVGPITRFANRKYIFLIIAVAITIAFYASNQTRFLPLSTMYSSWLLFALLDSKGDSKFTFLRNRLTAYISSISMEIYLCHMPVFRIVEKSHLASLTSSNTCNYVITFGATLLGAILFAHVVKFIVFPKLGIVLNKLCHSTK